jgi:hypothetical protein
MSASNQPLRLDQSDLFSPKVEEYLEERAALRRAMPDVEEQSLFRRIVFSSYCYLGVACTIGAIVSWMIVEPFKDDDELDMLSEFLLFSSMSGCIGLFLGAAEGIMCRNLRRAAINAAVGLGIGFAGGLIVTLPAEMAFNVMVKLSIAFAGEPRDLGHPTGLALLILIMGRGAAWAMVAIPAGIGQGIAVREQKVILNGILGGILGGLLGGLLFDPIGMTLSADDGSLSRFVACAVIGLLVGVFVGLVEQWTKTAWLLMRAGPLAGKQFVLFKQAAVLGSSPKADIYLFKDDAIEPRHALIHNRGGRFEIEDCGTADGTYVNGIPIKMQILRPGDQIVLGRTVLEFSLKESQ